MSSFVPDYLADFTPYFVEGTENNGPDYMTGWDLTVLGGSKLPGITQVVGAQVMLRRDANKAAGKNGGRPVYHGLEEQRLQFKVIVWKNSQMAIMYGLRGQILPIAGKEPKNTSIVSEWSRLVGITSVTILGAIDWQPHSSERVRRGLELTLFASHWLGDSKAAGKNVSTQPARTVATTRPYTPGAPKPTSVGGACGPPNFQPGL